jgi:LPS-assembly protein
LTILSDQLTYDRPTDTFHASGNVRIEGEGMVLTADSASLTNGGRNATASGKVVFQRGETRLSGEWLVVDLTQGTGEMTNGTLLIPKGNFRLTGSRIAKTGESDYLVEQGSFTTCDADPPSWRFTSSSLKVSGEEQTTGSDVVFSAGGVPLFYTPYLMVPVMKERQSGFLFPRIGDSSIKGFTLQAPYYWAIDPSRDLTITPTFMSRRGLLLAGDYRYIRRLGSEGQLSGSLLYDTEESRWRGDMKARVADDLGEGNRLSADVHLLSDRNYFKDFAEATGVYNQQFAESRLFLAATRPSYTMGAELLAYQNLEASNNTTLQRLPRLTYSRFRQNILDSSFSYTFDAAVTNFYREVGSTGQRLELSPLLSWHLSPGGLVELTPWAGVRQRFYNTEGDGSTDGFQSDTITQAGLTAATTLTRVYEVEGEKVKRLRHVMTPEISYRWVGASGQDSLTFFDYDDRVVNENMVFYSLGNSLTARLDHGASGSEYRDLLSLRIGQGYSFSATRRDLLTLVDQHHPFTDVMLDARIQPLKELGIALDTRYNPYEGKISSFILSGDFRGDGGNTAGFAYRYAREEVEYLEAHCNLLALRPWVLGYRSRYSLDRHGHLEQFFSLEYRKQCWSILATYRHRLDDDELQVGFTLYGIGSLGTVSLL